MHKGIAEGIRLFNSQKFFEAHEALESVWLTEQGEEKLFLHGLIQVAAAFHHHQRKNPEGFRRVLAKGMNKLIQFQGTRDGIDVDGLKGAIEQWVTRGVSGHSSCPLPEIRLRLSIQG